MLVVSVIPSATYGGAHNQAVQLRRQLDAAGCRVVVILPCEPGNAKDRLAAAGLRVIELPLHRLRSTASIFTHLVTLVTFIPETVRLARLLRSLRADVVQTHGITCLQAPIAAAAIRVPIVWQLLDTRPPILLRRIMMPIVRRLASVVMTTGHLTAAAYPGLTEIGPRLVEFVPPVDHSVFRVDASLRQRARTLLGVAPRSFVVGCIANRNPQKDLETLIRATRRASRTRDEIVLRLRGSRVHGHLIYSRNLDELSLSLQFETDAISEFPPGAASQDLLPGFDVLVMSSSSRSEGIPTVLLEAMASGLPVVTTDVGGVREVVEDGVNGYVVAVGDEQALADALVSLASNPGRAHRFGCAGRVRVEQRWNISTCATDHLRAYQLAHTGRQSRD
jgi:glycosyltransferase involved in cell wall biosynthesis